MRNFLAADDRAMLQTEDESAKARYQ